MVHFTIRCPVPEIPNLWDGTLVAESIFDNEIDCGNPVFPPYLLSLGVIPAAVGDGNFKDPTSRPGNLGRKFGLEPKSIFT